MYLSPPSGRMATIRLDGSLLAARSAANTLAPDEIPARMPSLTASSAAVLTASSPATVSMPPRTDSSRFLGTKLAPMPWILCGPARPSVTRGLSAGSIAMTFALDPSSRNAFAIPVAVPPVPNPT